MTFELRPILEWPGYYAGNDGVIYSERRGTMRALKGRTCGGTTKYIGLHICIDGKPRNVLAHHGVLFAWHGGRSEGMECRHLDGDATNNKPENLAWGTKLENSEDMNRHGTRAFGVKHGSHTMPHRWRESGVLRRKLSDDDCDLIRATYSNFRGGDAKRLAERFGVTIACVSAIGLGRVRVKRENNNANP